MNMPESAERLSLHTSIEGLEALRKIAEPMTTPVFGMTVFVSPHIAAGDLLIVNERAMREAICLPTMTPPIYEPNTKTFTSQMAYMAPPAIDKGWLDRMVSGFIDERTKSTVRLNHKRSQWMAGNGWRSVSGERNPMWRRGRKRIRHGTVTQMTDAAWRHFKSTNRP